MENLTTLLMLVGIAVGTLLALGFILSRLYNRAPKDAALIRTGFGGQKVILNGGVLVLPVFHDLMRVSLKTIKMDVDRGGGRDALLTSDRIRVDVIGTFHVRVAHDESAIAKAAETLGDSINNPKAVEELLRDKLISALRSAAATMTMDELHQNRSKFIDEVSKLAKSDLDPNGLELETVALTHFDQTPLRDLNEENAFDAVGMTAVKRITEQRRRERNDIEAETRVAIETRNLEAERKSLDIARDSEHARLDQEREIETTRAQQEADLAKTRAERKRESEEARIEQEKLTESAEISKKGAIEITEIKRIQQVEISRQEQAIAIAEKSEAESAARARAEDARAQAVRAEESVLTAREVAEAERQKQVAVVRAEEKADAEAVSVRVQAEAEREAAENRAAALRTEAHADRDAQLAKAEGTRARLTAEAEGQTAVNTAANILSKEQIELERTRILSGAMPAIITASAKPMENIDSIKIVDIGGLTGKSNGSAAINNGPLVPGNGNLADQVVSAGLQYRAQRPLVDGLVNELFGGDAGLEGLVTGGMPEAIVQKTSDKPVATAEDITQLKDDSLVSPEVLNARGNPDDVVTADQKHRT